MTALVWFYAGALIGLSIFLALPGWREANRRLDEQLSDALADIDFKRWERDAK